MSEPNSQTGSALSDAMRGSNQSGMRAWNERLVLTLVRQHGALPKADIARTTGLSAQTVSVIMRSLESDGLLLRGEPLRGKVGQPSIPLSLDPQGAFFLGLKIGRRSSEMILTDFLGRIIGRRVVRYRWPQVQAVIDFSRSALVELRTILSPVQAGRIAGLGIAMPFRLWDWAPAIGAPVAEMDAWRGCNIRETLAQGLDFPVFLENDATAACGAELVFGNPDQAADFVYFYIGFFVGGGIVLNGSLFTGRNGNAAALGSMPVQAQGGQTVQLIDLASIAVLERLLIARGMPTDPVWLHDGVWQIDAQVLADWIDNAAHGLAQAIASCVSVIDFDSAVIDGWFPADIRERIVQRTGQKLAQVNLAGISAPDLRPGTLGAEARALGGAGLPLSERFLVDPNALIRAV